MPLRVPITAEHRDSFHSRTGTADLFDAVERFGTPKILRTDNEPAFRSRLWGFALALLGIKAQRTRPFSPDDGNDADSSPSGGRNGPSAGAVDFLALKR